MSSPLSRAMGRGAAWLCAAACLVGCDPARSSRVTPAEAPAPSVSPPNEPAYSEFLKGQLHLHSGKSGDSHTAPEVVADWYAARGFDFIVFTDHNVVTDTPDRPSMLTMPGVELTQNPSRCEPPPDPGQGCLLHVNALFVTSPNTSVVFPEPSPLSRVEIFRRGLKEASRLGGIAQINHPNFHRALDVDLLVTLAGEGAALLEVANEAVDSENQGDARQPSTEALWDAALTRGARLFGTATDDAHHYFDADAVRAAGDVAHVGDRGFVMVRAEKRASAIRDAVLRGDFYGSTGLFFDRLELSPEAIAVDVRGSVPVTIEVIGAGGVVLKRVDSASLRFDPREAPAGYVRVRAKDGNGKRAFSQPVWTRPKSD